MCGIIGAAAQRNVSKILLDCLKKLEYRGYDSAGIAVIDSNSNIKRVRVKGKVDKLTPLISNKQLKGKTGIAHSRWATHGKPTVENAHPHISNNIAIVHNGIIENHTELKKFLINTGYTFESSTDSETIAHLINYYITTKTSNIVEAVKLTIDKLDGAYALGIIDENNPDKIIAVKHGSPLTIGFGIEENFISSDPNAISNLAQNFIYLEDGDIAEVSSAEVKIYNKELKQISRKIDSIKLNVRSTTKGKYRHFMQKEIFEQPQAIANTISEKINEDHILLSSFGETATKIFPKIEKIHITACGTSYYAGLTAKYWFEEISNIPTIIDIASEYRYKKVIVEPNTLFITISQSGETADTLEALRKAKGLNYLSTMSICNVPMSSLVRESEINIATRAGIEIGVASTKAFTTQLTALLISAIAISKAHNTIKNEKELISQLNSIPTLIKEILKLDDQITKIANLFADKDHAFFLGRGIHYPIALEGALKLKEISYLHAEGYPAGELKHGPLALIEPDMPVVVVAPNNDLLEKLISNIHEVLARGGKLIVFADSDVSMPNEQNLITIKMPIVSHNVAPIIHIVPLQLLAYHVAILKGTDIDQPRNLAKSVTVE